MFQPRVWLLVLMILVPVGLRLVEHPWNVAPIGALALFAGAHFRGKSWAFLVPICAMFLGDIALGIQKGDMALYTFYPLAPVTYGCYALYVCLGWGVRRSWNWLAVRETVAGRSHGYSGAAAGILPVAGATFAGAVLFYLITNFGVWAAYDTYPKTAGGLIQCYVSAIEFFRRTLAGDAFYATLLFGGYALLKHRLPVTEQTGLHAERT